MLTSCKSLRRGVLAAAAVAALAMGVPAAVHAHGAHHHHHHHGHHHWHYWPYASYVGGYGRCSYWRSVCTSRWGFGTQNYGVCLWRHGC